MKQVVIFLMFLSLVAMAKEVPQHYSVENLPLGWNTSSGGVTKGDVKDANAPCIRVQYHEFAVTTTEDQMINDVRKTLVTQYGKLVDLGPTSVASHATEGYQAVDLGGIEHRFYIITDSSKVPYRGWMIEVRGRKNQLSTIEAEISLILAKLKLT